MIQLPLSRVKLIIKTDPDTTLASQEAVLLVAKVTKTTYDASMYRNFGYLNLEHASLNSHRPLSCSSVTYPNKHTSLQCKARERHYRGEISMHVSLYMMNLPSLRVLWTLSLLTQYSLSLSIS